MKITSNSPLGSKSVDRAGRKSNSTSQSFRLDESEESAKSATSAQVSRLGPIASLDSLLALQEASDASSGGRSKGLKIGHGMLDILEGLRRAILLGAVSVSDLRKLADMARNRKGTGDQRLDAILEEVELRAEVELAKYGF